MMLTTRDLFSLMSGVHNYLLEYTMILKNSVVNRAFFFDPQYWAYFQPLGSLVLKPDPHPGESCGSFVRRPVHAVLELCTRVNFSVPFEYAYARKYRRVHLSCVAYQPRPRRISIEVCNNATRVTGSSGPGWRGQVITFYKRLASLLATKWNIPYSSTTG